MSINNEDLMLVNQSGVDYKTTAEALKEYLTSEPNLSMPWEEDEYCVFHVKNATQEITLYGSYTGWDIDGTNERQITTIQPGEEVVFVTDLRPQYLFHKDENHYVNWEFGPLTDVSRGTHFGGMFMKCREFNSDIGFWDTHSAVDMVGMFDTAENFNQDLSQWCVPDVGVGEFPGDHGPEPHMFSYMAKSWEGKNKPCWGHCPRGEHGLGEDPCPKPPMPWDDYDAVFHIKNPTKRMNLTYGGQLAWDIDGTNERRISSIEAGEELVFAQEEWDAVFFRCAGTWDFGELTDTSKMTYGWDNMFTMCDEFNGDVSHLDTSGTSSLNAMFYFAPAFNHESIKSFDTSKVESMNSMFLETSQFNVDISGWDTSNVTSMSKMFEGAKAFNQDLSQWCVPKISSKPDRFDNEATLYEGQTAIQPQWGTCPRGENQ